MRTMIDPAAKAKLEAQRTNIARWLQCSAPYAECDQKHLDAGTTERAYWHLGYQSALADVLKLLDRDTAQMFRNGDTSN